VHVDDPAFVVATELATQMTGVAVECVGCGGSRISPQVGKELVFVEDSSRVSGEVGEQVVFQAPQG
jgi:hypothetical protein